MKEKKEAGMSVPAFTAVTVQEIPLIQNETAMCAIRELQKQGYTVDDIREVYEHHSLL